MRDNPGYTPGADAPAQRRRLATERARWLVVAAVTAAGAAWLLHRGPEPIIRITIAQKETAPYWYMLFPFPVFGMLVADFLALLADRRSLFPAVELGAQITVLAVVSALRLVFELPVSGHALLLSYFILRRVLVRIPAHESSGLELAIAVFLFGITAYWKLVLWSDLVTLAVGAGMGIALAAESFFVVTRMPRALPGNRGETV